MKVFSTLILAAAALTASAAQPKFLPEPYEPQQPELTPMNMSLITADSSVKKAFPKAKSNTPAPETLSGKTFITVYNNGEIMVNAYLNVSGTNDDLTLVKGAKGYHLKASYNPETGTLTIPTGVVIGTSSSYGDITLCGIEPDPENPNSLFVYQGDLIGTWNGEGFTFNHGIGGKVSAGILFVMFDYTMQQSNGIVSFLSGGNSYAFPIRADKKDENTLTVVGLSNVCYNAYVPVDFPLDEATGTSTLPFPTLVDKRPDYASPAYIDYYLCRFNEEDTPFDFVATVTTTENTSTLKSDLAAYAYQYPTNGIYGGFEFEDFALNIDFNVYTGVAKPEDNRDTDTPVVDNILYLLDRTNMTATVTDVLPAVSNLTIPSEIEVASGVYTVTSVAAQALMNNTKITDITLPTSIKTVGTDAFRNLPNLRKLHIVDLPSWCAIDFANCYANPLYNLFPGTDAGKWGTVYINNEEVTELVIPEGIESFAQSFYGFKSLTSITLPSSLKDVGNYAFGDCIGLTEVTIPANVKVIRSIFYGCSNLKKVTILGNSLTNLGSSAFEGCTSLEEINIPEGVLWIGMATFSSCNSLKKLSLPSTLLTIGVSAIGCPNLESLECLAAVPPTASNLAFEDVNKDIPVYVPANSIERYKEAAEWKDFTNFLPAQTGVEVVETENVPTEYYNLQGIRVAEPKEGNVYIRRQGDKTVKVIL